MSSNLEDAANCDDDDDINDAGELDVNRIVLHIIVVGFHHKHGYQVDYCYPPLTPHGPVFSSPMNVITLPQSWKTLPLLCLPDGSHNYDSDTIYFTMPDVSPNGDELLQQQKDCNVNCSDANNRNSSENNEISASNSSDGIKTIFGTACYRQIQVNKLRNRTDDMTRLSVQKSVCVLSTQPLFGLIRSKLEMITHAYFEELDFSKVRILRLTYDNLNSLLARPSVRENATFLGLSARHLVSHFGCNMLVLFKAMLLEKKILFYKSPVRDLCSTIMSMCSLFPGLLECNGLDKSTCDLQLSPQLLEALKLSPTNRIVEANSDHESIPLVEKPETKVFFSPSKNEVILKNLNSTNYRENNSSCPDGQSEEEQRSSSRSVKSQTSCANNIKPETSEHDVSGRLDESNEYELINRSDELHKGFDHLDAPTEEIIDDPIAHNLCQSKHEECGLPLQIFTRGSFCLPYLSISYLDLLSDNRVKSFVIGATNFLFKQRREMYDVIVDMEENSITINDPLLKRHLGLTIEDLRFMDYLSRQVKLDGNQQKDYFDHINNDITKWVGGDEWIRYHFKIYTLYLLKAAKSQQNIDSFNASFVQTWKQTSNNYRIWDSSGKWTNIDKLQAKHPFSSNVKGINFSDMKLKLNYAVNSSDKGKIVNQTLNGIGKWSIWNNLASAGNIAATTVSTLANSAAVQTNMIVGGNYTSTNLPTTSAANGGCQLDDNDDDQQ